MRKSDSFWKTITLCLVFILAVIANACDDTQSYPVPGGEEIVVKDDKIQSPGWLVQVVDSVATGRVGAYDGFIPWVYLVEIRGSTSSKSGEKTMSSFGITPAPAWRTAT